MRMIILVLVSCTLALLSRAQSHIPSGISEEPQQVHIDAGTLYTKLTSSTAHTMPLPIGRPGTAYTVAAVQTMEEDFYLSYPDIRSFTISSDMDHSVRGRITVTPEQVWITYRDRDGFKSIHPQGDQHVVELATHQATAPTCSHDSKNPNHVNQDWVKKAKGLTQYRGENFNFGTTKRRYRMAVVTTGEFFDANGGNMASAMAAVVSSIDGFNAVYNFELNVEFVGLTPVIFTNSETDPFIPNEVGGGNERTLQAGEAVDAEFNSNSYDIGHVFHTHTNGDGWGNGGVARLGVVCNNNTPLGPPLKAMGWSGAFNNLGFGWLNLACHEIAHMFGAEHTFNGTGGSCTEAISNNSAYEIGSGTTIMSYSGTCEADQNIQETTEDDYFHVRSLFQMSTYILEEADCAVELNTGNTAPIANANPCGLEYSIPKRTPYRIRGEATDAEDDPMTYTWEQYDEDGADNTDTQGEIGGDAANNILGPLVRSYPPGSSLERTIPTMETIMNGLTSNPFEVLSNRQRDITFQLTVRDNHDSSGGAIATSELVINCINTGPLAVNNVGTVTAGEQRTFEWDTNGSDDLCELVNVYLSVDNGTSFPYTLAEGVSYSDGQITATLSAGLTAVQQARLMVECADNDCVTFFAVSNFFRINSDCLAPATFICDTEPVTADQGDPALDLDLKTFKGAPIEGFSEFLGSNSETGPRVIFDESQSNCLIPPFSPVQYEDVLFATTESGTYIFRGDPSNGTRPYFTIFDADTYDPADECNSFVGSSAFRTAMGSSFSYFYPLILEGCQRYFIRLYNADPNSTSIVTVSGPSPIIGIDESPDADYSETYIAIRADGTIGGVSADADFTTLSGGTYQVHAISYKSGGTTPPALVDPTALVGKNVTDLYDDADCSLLSDEFKPVEVISGCGILELNPGTQTVCDPATNTYSQVIEVVYENPPPGGFLRVNGVQFAIAGSPQTVTLQGLPSNGDPVAVSAEFTEQPSCSLFLQGVFTAPENCCPIDVDLGVDALEACSAEVQPLDAGPDGSQYQWLLDNDIINGATEQTYIPTQSGIYTVDVTAPAGCVVSDEVLVTIYESPSVTLGDDLPICDGAPTTIEGESVGGTLQWYLDDLPVTGAITSTIEVTAAGQYVLQATSDDDCTASDTITIDALPTPIVDLGDDQDLCVGDGPIILDAGTDGTTYQWFQNTTELPITDPLLTVEFDGQYIVSVTNDGGCSTTDTVNIEFYSLPTADAGMDLFICDDGEPVELFYAVFAESFLWYKDGIINSNQDDPLIITEGGEYVLEARNEIGCIVRDTVNVTAVPPPMVELGDPIVGCEGSTVTLSTELPGTYVWVLQGSGPVGQDSALVVDAAGTYTLFVSNGGNCQGSDEVVVTFEPGPSLELGADVAICEGEETQLIADTEETTVTWLLDDNPITGETTTTLTATTAGVYTARVVGSSGCVVEDFLTLTVNDKPSFDIGPDQGICDGESVPLEAGIVGDSYLWQLNGADISTDPSVVVSEAGEVTLTVTNDQNCSETDNLTISVGSNPTLTLQDEYGLCEGQQVSIMADSDANTFAWMVNGAPITETGPTITVAEAADIMVTATNADNCSTSASTTVVTSAAPTVDLGEAVTVCPGDEITLMAGMHTTYLWTTEETTSDIIISNNGTTEVTTVQYAVTVTNADNCEAIAEVDITLLPELMPMVTSSAPGVCGGEPVTLTATGGSSFTWADPTSTLTDIQGGTAIAQPTETTTYEVTAANMQCPDSEVSTTVTVEVFERGADLTAGEEECVVLGQSIELSATGGISYQWDTSDPIVGASDIANPEVNPTEETVYNVLITDANLCTYADSVTICVLEDPLAEFQLVSIITPNGDGDNDELVFKGLEVFPENRLTIYNRWGNIVFKRSRYQESDILWDGTNGGEELPADTYYYVLEFDGNTYKSTVTIMR